MKKSLTLLLLGLLSNFLAAQVYEDFEGGPKLTWAPLNGQSYESVDNPDKTGANTSDKVGKLTNSDQSDFNFILAELPAKADLSKNNLLKMKVWSPIATKVLLKFEGTGPPVEQFVELNTINQWVDMSFDLSKGADYTGLTKILIAVNPFTVKTNSTFYIDDLRGTEPKSVYETFETGNEMGWKGLDGVLEAPVDNPAPNSVNSTAKCGKYTKSDKHSYSLLLADLGATTFDMSVNNQFKVQIHASAPTQVLMKLEGAGPAVEKIANIGLANAWQEYTFDFSAAKDFKHLSKAILFFDPGVETSADVYHFDNITAVPQGACAGVAKDPLMVDDFECNRNATYVNGWESISVINNPGPSTVNNSKKVGQYIDPQGEEWAALLLDYQNPIDLTTNNQLNIKIWSAKPSKFLAKLEGGSSPNKEEAVTISEAGTWVDYTVDFSSQALASHKKIVIFMNHGTLPAEGDVYYIDDIRWSEKKVSDLENFEAGATLPWEPLDQLNAIHGDFSVVDNPAKAEPNTSNKVGKYSKGSSAFSTLSAVAPSAIDISKKPQYNLDIWAPVGATKITFQLESQASGNKEVTRDIKNAGNWETVSFDFSNFQNITDWASMRILFNPGVEEAGKTYYFDNLSQSEATVDPCEGTQKIANIMDDFECQRNNAFGAGADRVTVVNNPKTTPVNNSTKVGLYKDPANEPWTALCAVFEQDIVLDAFNQLSIQVLSPQADVPFLLKLEGGTSNPKEVWTKITKANEWETISADFAGEKGKSHKRACFFFNGGVENAPEINFHIDNLQFAHAPYDGCIMNFDDPAFISNKWRYFPADNSGDFELVDNPKPSDVNKSAKVGKAVEKASGEQPWQGMYTDLESYIKFGSNKIVKMKVLSPKVGKVTMKLERPLKEGAPNSGDNTIANTKANEWEELTWDFSTTPIVDDGQYARVTLIWDIDNVPTEDVIYYFDDIKTSSGDCGDLVSTNDNFLEAISVSPNPVSDLLQISNAAQTKVAVISDMFGRNVAVIRNNGSSEQFIDVSALRQGTYIITTYGSNNRPYGVTKFVKI